jgi:hypothetical protein
MASKEEQKMLKLLKNETLKELMEKMKTMEKELKSSYKKAELEDVKKLEIQLINMRSQIPKIDSAKSREEINEIISGLETPGEETIKEKVKSSVEDHDSKMEF